MLFVLSGGGIACPGYAGTAESMHNRGVEGCMPGSCDAAARVRKDGESVAEKDAREAPRRHAYVDVSGAQHSPVAKPGTRRARA